VRLRSGIKRECEDLNVEFTQLLVHITTAYLRTVWFLQSQRHSNLESPTRYNFTFKGPCTVKYMPINVQEDAKIYSLFISVNRSTYFGWYHHQSSGAHVTVSTASGIYESTEIL